MSDVTKSFKVHTDAIGGVPMQGSHLVAFKSRKLNDAEMRYAAHERELLAVVHSL